MTLTVGKVYRATFAGSPSWLGITRIELMDDGRSEITFRQIDVKWLPRFLWFIGPYAIDSGAKFVGRIDEATAEDDEPPVSGKSVSEVEVRYR